MAQQNENIEFKSIQEYLDHWDKFFEETREALTSPLFCEHNFKKFLIIFLIKNNLFFLINK